MTRDAIFFIYPLDKQQVDEAQPPWAARHLKVAQRRLRCKMAEPDSPRSAEAVVRRTWDAPPFFFCLGFSRSEVERSTGTS